MKRVLIGICTFPGHAHCRDVYLEAINKMIAHAENNDIRVDTYVLWNGDQPHWGFDAFKVDEYVRNGERGIDMLANKQNIIRKRFLKGNYDYLFISETDTIPVEDTLTAFVNYDKDMISSPYIIESTNFAVAKIPTDNPKYAMFAKYAAENVIFQRNIDKPCVWGLFKKQARLWDMEDLFPQRGLVRCMAAGFGACLISRETIAKVGEFRVLSQEQGKQQFTDFMFGIDAYNKGYQAFVDTDRISNHLHYDFDTEQIFTKWFNPEEAEKFSAPTFEENPYEKKQ